MLSDVIFPKSEETRAGIQFAAVGAIQVALLALYCVGGYLVYASLNATSSLWEGIVEASPALAQDSTDGHLLFAVGDLGDWHVYVSDARGGHRRFLGHNVDDSSTGGFSPNGQWLFFVAADRSQTGLWVADSDGAYLRRLLSAPGASLGSLGFSDDGWVLSFKLAQDHDGGRVSTGYVYSRRSDRLVDLTGYDLRTISSDGRWALIEEQVTGDEGTGRTARFELVDTETGLWQALGEFGRPSEASLAPDGSYVIVASYDRGQGGAQVRSYRLDEGRWSSLVDSRRPVHVSQFLPDGRHFLLIEDDTSYLVDVQTGHREFYLRGYATVGLGDFPGLVEPGPQAGDGVVVNVEREGSFLVYVAGADGADARPVAENAVGVLLADGVHVLLIHFQGWDAEVPVSGYSLLDLRSGTERSLLPSTGDGNDVFAILHVSPDGSQIVVHDCRLGDRSSGPWSDGQLWLFDVARMQAHHLTPSQVAWNWGAFSSDGSKIVYSSTQFNAAPADVFPALYVADAGGGNPRLVVEKAVPFVLW